MKQSRKHFALFAVALLAAPLILLALFAARPSSNVETDTLARTNAATLTNAAAAVDLSAAAARNATLRNELVWTFGGKQQRGWYLYDALIGRLLETDRGAETTEFAASLARWQRKRGLAASGILDEETLLGIISAWQSIRLKDKSYPNPDQLLVAPVADFFDATRPDDQRQIERQTYAAYKKMIAAAVADRSLKLSATRNGELSPSEKYLKIISAFRSRERQEQLRQQSPNSGSAGLAVNSPHFTGRALDLYVGGQPVETRDANRAIQVQTPVYKWLVKNASRFGFRPYFFEPWHWEHVE